MAKLSSSGTLAMTSWSSVLLAACGEKSKSSGTDTITSPLLRAFAAMRPRLLRMRRIQLVSGAVCCSNANSPSSTFSVNAPRRRAHLKRFSSVQSLSSVACAKYVECGLCQVLKSRTAHRTTPTLPTPTRMELLFHTRARHKDVHSLVFIFHVIHAAGASRPSPTGMLLECKHSASLSENKKRNNSS